MYVLQGASCVEDHDVVVFVVVYKGFVYGKSMIGCFRKIFIWFLCVRYQQLVVSIVSYKGFVCRISILRCCRCFLYEFRMFKINSSLFSLLFIRVL